MPADEISILFNLGIGWMIQGVPIAEKDQFVNFVPGWTQISEARQQDIERWWTKKQLKGEATTFRIEDYWRDTTMPPIETEKLDLPN